MKRILFVYLLIANLFSFVTVYLGMPNPWYADNPDWNRQERVAEVLTMAQSALGGAAGSYAGLVVTKDLGGSEDDYLRIALYVLMGQNALLYLTGFVLIWRRGKRESVTRDGRQIPSGESEATGFRRTPA